MKEYLFLAIILGFSLGAAADGRLVFDDGIYIAQYDGVYDNADMFAPWNDSLKKDDIFAPWNDPLHKNDMFAPWNDPMSGASETNRYMRKQGERNSDYYWK